MKDRKNYKSEFKTKVVLESLKERDTIEELCAKYELTPQQLHWWKKQFLDGASQLFEEKANKKEQEQQKTIDELYAQVGKLQMNNEWLKKKLNL